MTTPFERATNLRQYDLEDTGWQESFKGLDSPTRFHFWQFIEPYSNNWRRKRLLDVGTGTGWLLDLALKAGVTEAVGIDPSWKNIEVAVKLYPNVKVVRTTLEEFQPVGKFGVATAIFSLSNISDIDFGLDKISQCLYPNGEFLAIIPDFSYNRLSRSGYEIQFQELNDQEYVVQVKRPHGTIADVVRTTGRYIAAGKKCGLKMIEDIPMKPTPKLMEQEPRYQAVKDLAMTHLLRFVKI